jgi:catechol 2,3-dioxygenase-like lactoylglutathione lyase family enzyme
MITAIDHIVVLVSDLAAAAAAYELLLGRAPSWRSSAEGSETVLFTLRNASLELMAPSGDGPVAQKIRSVIETSGEGLASLCFRVGDIEKLHRRLERVALKPDAVAAAESRDTSPGSDATLSWKRTRLDRYHAGRPAVLSRTGGAASAVAPDRAGADRRPRSHRDFDLRSGT